MQDIIDKILRDTTVRWETCHGIEHWERVARYGRFLARREGLEERILLLFAYFHDCQRLSDGRDPEHGPRAADYLMTYAPETLGLSVVDRNRLFMACRHHTYECETDDVTIQACWDSDRLDIGRIGYRPDPARLFTKTAKAIARGQLRVVGIEEVVE